MHNYGYGCFEWQLTIKQPGFIQPTLAPPMLHLFVLFWIGQEFVSQSGTAKKWRATIT